MKIRVETESLFAYYSILNRIEDLMIRRNFKELIKITKLRYKKSLPEPEKNEKGRFEFTIETLKESKMLLIPIPVKKKSTDLIKLKDIFIYITVDEGFDKTVVSEMIYDQFVGYQDYIDSNIFLNYDIDEYINVGFCEESEYLPLFVFMRYYDSDYERYNSYKPLN